MKEAKQVVTILVICCLPLIVVSLSWLVSLGSFDFFQVMTHGVVRGWILLFCLMGVFIGIDMFITSDDDDDYLDPDYDNDNYPYT